MSGDISEEAASIEGWVAWELQCLWSDLFDAQQRAANGDWSIDCDDKAQRIRDATSLVGPVRWQDIGMSLIVNGWFVAMNTRIGIDNPNLPTPEDVAKCRAMQEDSDRRLRGLV